jgi:hypothetical protein
VFHRGIKQCCGLERAQVRKGRKVFNHICLSIRAFLRLEVQRLESAGMKALIIREAIRSYLANPVYKLGSTA